MDLEEMLKFAKRKRVIKTAYQLMKEENHQEAYDLLMQSETVDTMILGDLGQHFLGTGEYVEAIDLYTKMGEISGNPKAVQDIFHEHLRGLQKTEDYDGIISISETLLERGYKMLE